MDATLTRLTHLVAGKDMRLASASAVILAELAPRDPAVTSALKEALEKSDGTLRSFVIDALGRIGTPQAADALVPCIQAGGPVSEEALRAVAHAGAGALKPLAKMLPKAPPDLQPKLAEAIVRTGERQGFAAVVEELREPETARAIREGVRHAISGLDEKARGALLAQLTRALGAATFVKNESAAVAALEMVGDLRDADALQLLLKHTGKDATPRARGAALRSIGMLRLDADKRGRLAGKLLPLLHETDFSHTVEPTLRALDGADIGGEHRRALEKLVASTFPEVREFAMRALAVHATPRTLAELIKCLDDPDRTVREDAAQALARAPNAAVPLSEKLAAVDDGEASRTIANVLREMADGIPDRVVTRLAQAYVELAAGAKRKAKAGESEDDLRRNADARRGALLLVLRAAGKSTLASEALKEARALRTKGEPQRALSLLRSVAGVEGWNEEHRVEQALAGLAVTPLDLSRTARAADPNLRLLEEAVSGSAFRPKELARQVLKDRTLSRRIQYYVGHHFAERMQSGREFGREILVALAKNARSEEGKQAKQKLAVEGLLKGAPAKKRGILEERAEVLMAAADLAAKSRAEEDLKEQRRQARERCAQKNAFRQPAKRVRWKTVETKPKKKSAQKNAKKR
ncbi:MAG: HEAT repeat domain-containing protein [Planctomycetes bacterium]|nr:HEAT repeat domain-containing protein [Planctomycetota bacterium]